MQGGGIYSYHTCWLDFAKGIHTLMSPCLMMASNLKDKASMFHWNGSTFIHHASLPL
jgi:hypothetical protein